METARGGPTNRDLLKTEATLVLGALLHSSIDTEKKNGDVSVFVESITNPNVLICDDRLQNKLNRESKEAFKFANEKLNKCFDGEAGFSVAGVNIVTLVGRNIFDSDQQVLINLVGNDANGKFTFNLIRLDNKYFPLFNISELPPFMTEKPKRMPVVVLPNENDKGSFQNMWSKISFGVCPTGDRSVYLKASREKPDYRLFPWIADYESNVTNRLSDVIMDGISLRNVRNGLPEVFVPTSSGEFISKNYGFDNWIDMPIYLKKEGKSIVAINENDKKVADAYFNNIEKLWVWRN